MRIFLCSIFTLIAFGCAKTLEGNTLNNIVLHFNKISKEYKQGSVSFSIELSNNGDKKLILPEWIEENASSNFGVIAKNEKGSELQFHDDAPRSSIIYSNFSLLGKTKKNLQIVFICTLPPGKYKIQAFLKSYPDIKTKWRSILITKGRILDLRK